MQVLTCRISQVDAEVLVNAANGIGVMGAGVAADLAAAFPWAEPIFRAACTVQHPEPGEVLLTCPPDARGPTIWHAVTMKFPGSPTTLSIIARCLSSLYTAFRGYAPRRGSQPPRIAVPALGTGHGRLRADGRYLELFRDFATAIEQAGGKVILVGPAFLPLQPAANQSPRHAAR